MAIPGHPPGGNELHRMNRFQVRKSREEWKRIAVLMTPRNEPMPRASLAVTWRYRIRRTRDLDNLVAGLKPLVDGIVAAGVIPDDGSDVLVSLGPFAVETGCPRDETILIVTEAP